MVVQAILHLKGPTVTEGVHVAMYVDGEGATYLFCLFRSQSPEFQRRMSIGMFALSAAPDITGTVFFLLAQGMTGLTNPITMISGKTVDVGV